MELRFVRSCRNLNFPLDRFAVRLIILRQSLSNVGSAEPHDRVLSGVVVRSPTEHFNSDDTFPKRVIGCAEAMLDDIANQILALAARSKGGAPQNVFQQSFDFGSRGNRNTIEQRIVLSGHRRTQKSFALRPEVTVCYR